MIIDTEKRLCFVHIPGTAGMSIKQYLPTVAGANACTQSSFRAFDTIADRKHELDGYVFTGIVRNPYDRMVSIFMRMHREFPVAACAYPITPEGFEHFLSKFVKPVFDRGDVSDPAYTNLLMPMEKFACVNGEVALYRIIRYETLHDDLSTMMQEIYNVSYTSSSFPTVNMSTKAPLSTLGPIIYAEFYQSSSLAASLVETIYANDFTLFGYTKVVDWSLIPVIPKVFTVHVPFMGARPTLDESMRGSMQKTIVEMACLLMQYEVNRLNVGNLYNLAVFVVEKLHRLYGLDPLMYKRTNIDFMDAIDFLNMADFVKRSLKDANGSLTIGVEEAYVDSWIANLSRAIRDTYPNLQDIWDDSMVVKVKQYLGLMQ